MNDSFEVLQARAAMQDEVDRLIAENSALRSALAAAESRHTATTDVLVRKCSVLRSVAYEAARAVGWKVVEDDE